jgi:hypothetical protein
VGGFVLVAGSGDCPVAGSICSVAALRDGVQVVDEVGAKGRTVLPYTDLLALEIGGHGAITTGRQFYGGGSGVVGMATGVATAGALSSASQRTTFDSFMRIMTPTTEMIFRHPQYWPGAVRNSFSAMFVRYEAARRSPGPAVAEPASAADELERLHRLHQAGVLTASEYEAARAPHVRRLTGQGGGE